MEERHERFVGGLLGALSGLEEKVFARTVAGTDGDTLAFDDPFFVLLQMFDANTWSSYRDHD